jgi:hypothetical protein
VADQEEAAPSTEATTPEAESRISPWWLLAGALAAGAALTAIADLIPGSGNLSAIEWLGTTAGVAALIVAVMIYRLQERSGNEAHAELMDQLEAQNELLNDYAKRAAESGEEQKAQDAQDSLSSEQRTEIESRFGDDSISTAIDPGHGRGSRGNARLVRLRDGRLISVYDKRGHTYVREIGEPRERRPGRGR